MRRTLVLLGMLLGLACSEGEETSSSTQGGASGSSSGGTSSGGTSNNGGKQQGGSSSGGSSAGGTNSGGASGGTAGTGGEAGGNGAGAGGSDTAGSGGSESAGTGGSDTAGSGGTGGSDAAGSGGAAGNPGPPGVSIDGRRILVDGQPFSVRGVCWNPIPKGKTHPDGIDFPGFAAKDGALMAQAGINVVRTYEPLLDKGALDQLHALGLKVINSVYPWGGSPASVVTDRVNAVKDHPAILMWSLGNEWNYNGLYVGLSLQQSIERLNEAAALVKAADPTHPIATIYGELPSPETLAAMPLIDVWGLNVYRGISFGGLFSDWGNLSKKPMFLGEYGADAYNALLPGYDPNSQAEAVEKLTLEIGAHSSAKNPAEVCSGGAIFEWADEWWKAGNLDVQDNGGTAPGGGPYPDATFNEEWWGIVDIDRNPRPAYEAYKKALAAP